MRQATRRGIALGVGTAVLGIAVLAPIRPSSAIAAGLPNNRAYELVSPPEKNGGDVAGSSSRTRAAADGGAVGFESVTGFGDVGGAGVAFDYLSERSTKTDPGNNGWSTHAITPPQDPQTFFADFQAFDPIYEGDMSSDLSSGVFRAWSPLTSAPNVANVENLYVRHDLRTAGAGSYQLASACAACGSPLPPVASTSQLPFLAGASSDFSHVIFESRFKLTADAAAGSPNLYESVEGSLRLAGILPDSACGSPPCPAPRSIAGRGASAEFYTLRTISADGARVFFTVGGSDSANSGDLYVRDDRGTLSSADDATVQLNASERTDCADHDPCTGAPEPDPGGPQPATYWSASTDGTRAFFTSSEQLTDDDTNGANDLYMYDSGAPAGHHLTRLSVDRESADGPNDVTGVVGASDDGHYVYFLATGQLVSGKPVPSTGRGLFVWHDGSILYVGPVVAGADDSADVPGPWGLTPVSSRVSPDGKHLLFMAHSGDGLLSPRGGVDNDQTRCGGSGCGEFYLYTYGVPSDSLVCASCDPAGVPATIGSDNNGVRVASGASVQTWHLNHPLSNDGRFVFFNTNEPLTRDDVNGKSDAYEFDSQTGSVHLLSSGRDSADSYFLDASSTGRDVFFLTRERLVGWDTDQNYDLYDARIDGGFPDPPPASPACTADACRSAPSALPAPVTLGTSSFHGSGNQRIVVTSRSKTKTVRCKRGLVRKRVRGKVHCVKPKRRPQHRIVTRRVSRGRWTK